ncbi:MAG: ATP-binding protein [Oscillospiraceae bacterium]|jgi:predicted AAA+ superfamily ATPase|nr:ATP-binding protein [Oscillospiraceae bacterium]
MDEAQARDLLFRLRGVTVCGHALLHPAACALQGLLVLCAEGDPTDAAFTAAYTRVYAAWLDCVAAGQGGFADALLDSVVFTPSALATLCSRLPYDQLPYSVLRAAQHDLTALGDLAVLEPAAVLALGARVGVSAQALGQLPAWELSPPRDARDTRLADIALRAGSLPALAAFYRCHGTGLVARCPGLTWVGESEDAPTGLRGISAPDPIRLEDLVLYGDQRAVLVANTQRLLAGERAANILLYGDKGTGKSATVKALLQAYWADGLRIVEVPPARLTDLPLVFALLREQPCGFIVFVDDLAFAESCLEYTALKTVLEGGLEARPANAVVYATSNRRNILRQRFSDRQDDVSERDTLEEGFSLADRFDLRVTFLAPSQDEYLQIVAALAASCSIPVTDTLRADALAWAVARGGRSPRAARQFIQRCEGGR